MAGQNLGFPKLIASWLQSSQAERKAWLFVGIDMMINMENMEYMRKFTTV